MHDLKHEDSLSRRIAQSATMDQEISEEHTEAEGSTTILWHPLNELDLNGKIFTNLTCGDDGKISGTIPAPQVIPMSDLIEELHEGKEIRASFQFAGIQQSIPVYTIEFKNALGLNSPAPVEIMLQERPEQ